MNQNQIKEKINRQDDVFENRVHDFIDPLKNHPGLVRNTRIVDFVREEEPL